MTPCERGSWRIKKSLWAISPWVHLWTWAGQAGPVGLYFFITWGRKCRLQVNCFPRVLIGTVIGWGQIFHFISMTWELGKPLHLACCIHSLNTKSYYTRQKPHTTVINKSLQLGQEKNIEIELFPRVSYAHLRHQAFTQGSMNQLWVNGVLDQPELLLPL